VPLYEYECSKCAHRFENIEKVSAPIRRKCPKCKGTAKRLQSAPAIQFKGAGWYVTDYGRSKPVGGDAKPLTSPQGEPDKSEKPAAESKGGKETKEKTEKKEPSKKDQKK